MKKILTFALASALVLASFAGCSKTEQVQESDNDTTAVVDSIDNTQNSNDVQAQDEPEIQEPASPIVSTGRLSVAKVNSLGKEYSNMWVQAKAATYMVDGKKGIIAHDGSVDTGAKYTTLEACSSGGFFSFTLKTNEDMNPDDVSTLNITGVVNDKGVEIVPAEYATIDVLNERYIKATKVTEKTENKDEALVFFYTGMFPKFAAGEDDILYKGEWCIYDALTGKKVEGVGGTEGYRVNAYGKYINYYPDGANDDVYVDNTGAALTKSVAKWNLEYYVCEESGMGKLYDAFDDSLIFEYELDGFEPTGSFEGDYIAASKYVDGEYTYVVMDKKGNVVSAEFNDYIGIHGDFVECEDVLYNMNGEKIADAEYTSVSPWCKGYAMVEKDDVYSLVTVNGDVVYSGLDKNNYYLASSDLNAAKKIDDSYYYFNMGDNDFTLKGNSAGDGLVVGERVNSVCSLIDVFTGEVVLKGYTKYSITNMEYEDVYIYAYNSDGSCDVYELSK